MDAESVLQAVRRHLAARRLTIAEKFPKNLPRKEYHRHCGRHEELESFAAALQDAIRKANATDGQSPDETDD
jgi:hypothetical protein